MKESTKRLIIKQGYSDEQVCNCEDINVLIRWTPIMCAAFGSVGLFLQNPYYFMALGMLTSIGAFTNRSFYDHIYNYGVRPFTRTEKTPLHGKQRRFGCAIGSLLFILAGIGFYNYNIYLAYIPSLMIIILAFLASITQWCFASTLYNIIFLRKKNAEKKE